MSRSYKHTPYCGLQKDKFYKQQANKRLRRKKLTHDYKHSSYRRDYDSWEICDYYWIETTNFTKYYTNKINQWKQDKNSGWFDPGPCPTKQECWKEYCKYYKRK